MRDIHLMGIKPLDSWTLVWEEETGCRSSDIRQVSHETDFIVVLGDICAKIQALRHEYVPLKHYTFPRTVKKIRGNIGDMHVIHSLCGKAQIPLARHHVSTRHDVSSPCILAVSSLSNIDATSSTSSTCSTRHDERNM